MGSKMTPDPRLTKAEANLELARKQIDRITPSIGDPDPTTIAITHMATALEAVTQVLQDLHAGK